MIPLTRPDGSTLLVNPNRIETIEQTPDTVITLADGKKLLVRETAADVAARFLAHQRAVHSQPEVIPEPTATTTDEAAAPTDDELAAPAGAPAAPAEPPAEGETGHGTPFLDWYGLR